MLQNILTVQGKTKKGKRIDLIKFKRERKKLSHEAWPTKDKLGREAQPIKDNLV